MRGREVSSRLEMSPKRKPLAKAHALFYKGLKEVKGDESKTHVVNGKIQMSFFVGSAMAAKYTPEGEGHARNGWTVKSEVLQESVQSSVRLSLKPLLIQADERVVFPGSSLIARLTPGS